MVALKILLRRSQATVLMALVSVAYACAREDLAHSEEASCVGSPQQTSNRAARDYGDRGTKPHAAFTQSHHALAVKGDVLILRKDALGQLFALKPRYIEANNTPRILLGAIKLVTFKQHGDTLALMEPALHAVYNALPTERLVQTFAIERQNSDHVMFRWPASSGSLFWRDAQAPADLQPLVRKYVSAEDPVLPIEDGLLQSMSSEGDVVTLQHIVRTQSDEPQDPVLALFSETPSSAVSRSTYYSALQLSPYSDNAWYLPKPQTAHMPPYFLQVPRGQLHASETDYFAMTWDSHEGQEPITYDIAPNVPEDLVQAITDGVLYWNRAAHKTLAVVRQGATASLQPKARHVPIRWIPWHRPGAASIAEVQPDPLTGEILAAEIYLTSAFYEPSPQLLAQASEMTWSGRQQGTTCMAPRVAATTLLEAIQTGDGKTFAKRAMRDNIRGVVAHEVGHTLGLRHNFAASLDGQRSHPHGDGNRRALWEAYANGRGSGALVTSSVMDYLPDIDSILMGAFIQDGVLPYDAWIMGQGYGAEGTAAQPLSDRIWDGHVPCPWQFCSDGERVSGILGCRQFDSSPNPFAGALSEAQETLRHLPLELLLKLSPQDGARIDEAALKRALGALRPERFALPVAMITQELFLGLRQDVRVLSVERSLGHLRHSDPLRYHEAGLEVRKRWLDEVGGLPGILQGLLGTPGQWDGEFSSETIGWMARSLDSYIPKAPLGQGPSGPEPLDSRSQALLRQYGGPWAEAIEQAVLTDLLLTLTGEGPKVGKHILSSLIDPLGRMDPRGRGFDASLVDTAWQQPLCDWASDLIMATGEDFEHTGLRGQRIAKPRLTLEARLAAVRLLAPEVFHVPNWGQAHREQLAQQLLQRLVVLVDPRLMTQSKDGNSLLRTVGLSGFEEVLQLHTLPKPLQLWAHDELQLARVLITLNTSKRLPMDATQQVSSLLLGENN